MRIVDKQLDLDSPIGYWPPALRGCASSLLVELWRGLLWSQYDPAIIGRPPREFSVIREPPSLSQLVFSTLIGDWRRGFYFVIYFLEEFELLRAFREGCGVKEFAKFGLGVYHGEKGDEDNNSADDAEDGGKGVEAKRNVEGLGFMVN